MSNNVVRFVRHMSDKPSNPYESPAVAKAMAAISPESGGRISDVQAVAELCLSILTDFSDREAKDGLEGDPEYGQLMAEVTCKLKVAAELVEAAPYLSVDCE